MRALRRLARYLRHDFPEVVFPSSLPDPPDYVPPRRLSWREWGQAVREGTADYLSTWRAPPPEAPGNGSPPPPPQPTMMEELAATARSSAGLRPALGRLYQTQVAALQQAAAAFIEGYREGAAERPDLSALFPASQAEAPQAATTGRAEAGAAAAGQRSGVTGGGGGADAATLRGMLARSAPPPAGPGAPPPAGPGAPPPAGPGAPRDAVSQALSEAEALAAGVLGGGSASAQQRQALEAAIARAEAAMRAAERLPRQPGGSGSSGHK